MLKLQKTLLRQQTSQLPIQRNKPVNPVAWFKFST